MNAQEQLAKVRKIQESAIGVMNLLDLNGKAEVYQYPHDIHCELVRADYDHEMINGGFATGGAWILEKISSTVC